MDDSAILEGAKNVEPSEGTAKDELDIAVRRLRHTHSDFVVGRPVLSEVRDNFTFPKSRRSTVHYNEGSDENDKGG
ncbi:MAG: hypothetical protein O3B13_09740 [Planctomycetota bacterium]|nr:hypothetical protein [Planctomycetota bacterium]MDA1163371.1 hypothetical protein [Planctomycetota bacterium]